MRNIIEKLEKELSNHNKAMSDLHYRIGFTKGYIEGYIDTESDEQIKLSDVVKILKRI